MSVHDQLTSRMGFPGHFVSWLKNLLQKARFSVEILGAEPGMINCRANMKVICYVWPEEISE